MGKETAMSHYRDAFKVMDSAVLGNTTTSSTANLDKHKIFDLPLSISYTLRRWLMLIVAFHKYRIEDSGWIITAIRLCLKTGRDQPTPSWDLAVLVKLQCS